MADKADKWKKFKNAMKEKRTGNRANQTTLGETKRRLSCKG